MDGTEVIPAFVIVMDFDPRVGNVKVHLGPASEIRIPLGGFEEFEVMCTRIDQTAHRAHVEAQDLTVADALDRIFLAIYQEALSAKCLTGIETTVIMRRDSRQVRKVSTWD